MLIDVEEEFTRDWDWYAVDLEGSVGHFTSAGQRALPKSVKLDREMAIQSSQYFFELAPILGGWSIREQAEADCGGWKKQGKDRYIKDFALMASKGLFSFDTEITNDPNGRYFLVAIPDRNLRISDLPLDIQRFVAQTRAPLRFAENHYIDGQETSKW